MTITCLLFLTNLCSKNTLVQTLSVDNMEGSQVTRLTDIRHYLTL